MSQCECECVCVYVCVREREKPRRRHTDVNAAARLSRAVGMEGIFRGRSMFGEA